MSEKLTQEGYDQTKRKLADLESRLASIEARTDLKAEHRAEVIRSYKRMISQYAAEIRLFEATQRAAAK